jgi:hypothetical protein
MTGFPFSKTVVNFPNLSSINLAKPFEYQEFSFESPFARISQNFPSFFNLK